MGLCCRCLSVLGLEPNNPPSPPPYTLYTCLQAVLRIRIHMFLGLLDPDPLVRCMDPFRILLSSSKNSKKNLDSYYFVTPFDFLSLKNDVHVASKSNKQTKLC